MESTAPSATLAIRQGLAGQRVLVTGASGFIGSHVVERLIREGARVIALARTRGKLSRITRQESYTFVRCDVTDSAAIKAAVEAHQPQILFHFATRPDGVEGFDHAHSSIATNLVGTLNTLEAFSACRGRLFLYGDSCKVYGDAHTPYRESTPMGPNSSYAISKAAGWSFSRLYAHLHGIAIVSVRPTLIYGPHQSHNLIGYVVRAVLRGQPEIRLQGGDQTRDPLYVDDAIDAFVAAAESGESLTGRVLNLGGGREIGVLQLAERIVGLMGSSVPVICCPSDSRPTEIWRSYCDNAEARELIHWSPRFTLDQGLQRTIEHLVGSRGEIALGAS